MARGKVWKRGETWYYSVVDSSRKAVLADNTNNYERIADACIKGVGAVSIIERAGHVLQYSYCELVDRYSEAKYVN